MNISHFDLQSTLKFWQKQVLYKENIGPTVDKKKMQISDGLIKSK